MIVLLLGSGGREHALAWKISASPLVRQLIVLPGSDGIAAVPKVECRPGDPADPAAVVALARAIGAQLVVVGPEKPLEAGVADALSDAGIPVMGPARAAARLESSKIFSKTFMMAEGIPTAPFKVCDGVEAARAAVAAWDVEGAGVVIKADGLAAGKGVVVTHDRAEARKTVEDFMVNPACTVKTDRLLLEEKMTGREVSAFALCDGQTFVTLGYACDYKRVGDGDRGPNTGGMGGFAPHDWPSPAARAFIEENVFRKVVEGMHRAGTPFRGILFAGLMIAGDDVRVIEFNTRLGDPETQILMPLIEGDIVPLFMAAATGGLSDTPTPGMSGAASVHVVMTSGGYPETTGSGMRLGEEIFLPDSADEGTFIFLSGAKKKDGVWVNTGGRVLGVTGIGRTQAEARARAYVAVGKIRFAGAHWRKDIAG